MNLYHVQDNDRPMWVLAKDYGHAVTLWKRHVGEENDMSAIVVDEPQGVQFICDEDDLLNAVAKAEG